MTRFFDFLFAAFCLHFYSFGLSASDLSEEGTEFLLLEDHLVVVKGSIGDLTDLYFILDTGTTTSVISPYIAKKLNLKRHYKEVISAHSKKIRVQKVSLPEVRIGLLTSASMNAIVTDLRFQELRIDDLIGLDFLRNKKNGSIKIIKQLF